MYCAIQMLELTAAATPDTKFASLLIVIALKLHEIMVIWVQLYILERIFRRHKLS